MDITFMREAVTVISFAAFVAILAFVLHPGNRERFEKAGHLPLDEDGPSHQPSPKGEGANVGHVAAKGSAER